ncbi:hypothetical protein KUCAC02_025801, partial [Chaenocephalus aceratus]
GDNGDDSEFRPATRPHEAYKAGQRGLCASWMKYVDISICGLLTPDSNMNGLKWSLAVYLSQPHSPVHGKHPQSELMWEKEPIWSATLTTSSLTMASRKKENAAGTNEDNYPSNNISLSEGMEGKDKWLCVCARMWSLLPFRRSQCIQLGVVDEGRINWHS